MLNAEKGEQQKSQGGMPYEGGRRRRRRRKKECDEWKRRQDLLQYY